MSRQVDPRAYELLEHFLGFEAESEAEIFGPPPRGAATSPSCAVHRVRELAAQNLAATHGNVRALVQAISASYEIPWRIPYVVVEHETGNPAGGFRHPDGIMQTTAGARAAAFRAIPRGLALALLGRQSNDPANAAALAAALAAQFRASLAVQIAAGVQEIATNLALFSGYVALALVAYNAGPGWSFFLANRGGARSRAAATNDAAWEEACRFAASLLHQPPSAVNVPNGVYQCDSNMPGWFRAFFVRDRQSNITLVAYQYLRSIRACILERPPTEPCNAATHGQRRPGSGPLRCSNTRRGALDKIYQPALLGGYAAGAALAPIADDARPLKVACNQLYKMPNQSGDVAGTPVG